MRKHMMDDQDLDAAVAANIIDPKQKGALVSLALNRQQARTMLDADDEPFELFQGFAEIFISIGLVILVTGVVGLVDTLVIEGLSPLLVLVMCLGLAHYYLAHRRMVLPSITLLIGFTTSLSFITLAFVDADPSYSIDARDLLITGLVNVVVLCLFYVKYRLPFTMALLGVSGVTVFLAAARMIAGDTGVDIFDDDFFDLRHNLSVSLAFLLFGIVAFAAAMRFDLRDPHRVGTASKSAFWLHLIAGPAIINTVMVTLFNVGGVAGTVLTIGLMIIVALMSLVIDRRSFLTAGIIYVVAVISLATDGFGELSVFVDALLVGLLITVLGTWWRPLRHRVMRALPEFAGKDRLPPFAG